MEIINQEIILINYGKGRLLLFDYYKKRKMKGQKDGPGTAAAAAAPLTKNDSSGVEHLALDRKRPSVLQNIQQRKGHNGSRATNNDDISGDDESRMTHFNLMGGNNPPSVPHTPHNIKKDHSSQVIDPCMPTNVVVQYNGEVLTPKMFRQTEESMLQGQRKDGGVLMDTSPKQEELFDRQYTDQIPRLPNGFSLSRTGTYEMGENTGGMIQTNQSLDQFNSKLRATQIATAQPPKVVAAEANKGSTTIGSGGVSVNKQSSIMSNGSPRKSQQRLSQTSLANQLPIGNEHIISIFDKDTEKSYLLERQVLLPKQLAGDGTTSSPADNIIAKNGSSIFKVQEIGTAKFKCLPVTDYGKIMNLHKQREIRKVQTADGSRRVSRNRRGKTVGGVPDRQGGSGMPLSKTGVTSAETFHSTGKYKGKFAMVRTQQQQQVATRTTHLHQHNMKESPRRNNVGVWSGAKDKSGGTMSGYELRNSKSTVASNNLRKEVFSKTTFLNDQGVNVTNMQTFKPNKILSPTSSKGSQDPFARPQYATTAAGSQNDPRSRAPTAGTSVARRIYIDKLGNASGAGGPSNQGMCCCPTDIQSSITLNGNFQRSPSHCFQCETLTNSHRQNAAAAQDKKFLRKRAQSQGGNRNVHKFSVKNSGLLAGKLRQRNPEMYNKLQSIASGLKKKVVPMQEEQIKQYKESILKDYLSLLTFQNTLTADDEQPPNANQDLTLREKAPPEEQLFELLQFIKNNAERSEEQHSAMGDDQFRYSQPEFGPDSGVRPVRTSIIERVRGMPSYFSGRVKKDPIKQKQFQIPLESDNASNLDYDRAADELVIGATDRSSVEPYAAASAFDMGQTTKLQAAIKANQMQMYSSRGAAPQPATNQKRPIDDKAKNAGDKAIVQRNKTNMRTISADERDRLLFKVGLSSKNVLRNEQRQHNRRAWANRKVSVNATKLSNIAALLQENPPLSPLIKDSDKSEFNLALDLKTQKQNSNSPVAVEKERPRTQGHGGTNRKNLLLQQRKDSIGTNHVYDGTLLDEENGYILLAPRTLSNTNNNQQLLPNQIVANNVLTSLTNESVLNSEQLNSLTMMGRNPAFKENMLGIGTVGSGIGSDLNHVIATAENDIEGGTVTDQSNPDPNKMVKTYEFHLPMHHIREEEHRPSQHLDVHVKAQNNSRYNLSKQSTVFRITKKKTGPLARQDISSQNLEIETVADQASLRNLNLLGSGDPAFRFNQSQTSIRKKAAQSKRSQLMAQSLEAIGASVQGSNERIIANQNRRLRLQAAATSQSIEMNSQKFQPISPTRKESAMPGDVTGTTEKQFTKICPKSPLKKPLSHMANRVGESHTGRESQRENNNRSSSLHNRQQMLKANTKMPTAHRNSPLICLSQQDLQYAVEQNQRASANVKEGNHSVRVSEPGHHKPIQLRNSAVVLRSRTNPPHDSGSKSSIKAAGQASKSPKRSPRSPRKESKERSRISQKNMTTTTINHQDHLSPIPVQRDEEDDNDGADNDQEECEVQQLALRLDYAINIDSNTDMGKQIEAILATPHGKDGGRSHTGEPLEISPSSPAFLVLQSDEDGGTTEVLQINRKNFELFNKSQMDKHMLTTSSLSDSANFNNKCTTTLAVNHDTTHQLSGQNSIKMRDAENQIEVINISQAIQTQTDDCSPQLTHGGSRLLKKTPQISQLYVTTKSTSPPGKDQGTAMLRSTESRLRYIQDLLSDRETQKKFVPVVNFPTKQLQQGMRRNGGQRNAKSASGHPSTTTATANKRQLQKQFKLPGFKKAQMYLTQGEKKRPSLSSEQNGTQRFKTFRANNELYIRIDAFQNEIDTLQRLQALQLRGIEAPEANSKYLSLNKSSQATYNALLQNLKQSLLDEKNKQASKAKEETKGEANDAVDANNSPFNTLDFSHKPECPLHELEEFEQSQEAASWANYITKLPVYSQSKDVSQHKRNIANHTYGSDLSALSKYNQTPNEILTVQRMKNESSVSPQKRVSLEDQEGIHTVNAKASLSENTTVLSQAQKNAKYLNQKSLDSMKATITKSGGGGAKNKGQGKDRVPIAQGITQPVLWQVVAKKNVQPEKSPRKEQFGVQSSNRVSPSPVIKTAASGVVEIEAETPGLVSSRSPRRRSKGGAAASSGQQLKSVLKSSNRSGFPRLQSEEFAIQGKNPQNGGNGGTTTSKVAANNNNYRDAASSNGTYLSPQSVLRKNDDADEMEADGAFSKKHSLNIVNTNTTNVITEISNSNIDHRNNNDPKTVQQSRSLSQTPNKRTEPIASPASNQPSSKGGASRPSNRNSNNQVAGINIQSRRVSSNAASSNSRVASNPKFKLSGLVLQVYADKKHRRSTTSGAPQTQGQTTGVKVTAANQDIPFALHQANPTSSSGMKGSMRQKVSPIRSQQVGGISAPEPKQFTSVLNKTKGKTNPEILHNILQSKQRQVVVPRLNQYQQIQPSATGLDRAINFINFDKTRHQGLAATGTEYNHSGITDESYQAPAQQATGLGSARQSYSNKNQYMDQSVAFQQFMMHSHRSNGTGAKEHCDVMSIASDTTVQNENGQDRTFGAMIKGTGCLTNASYNQATVSKYEAILIENDTNRMLSEIDRKFYQEMLINKHKMPAETQMQYSEGQGSPEQTLNNAGGVTTFEAIITSGGGGGSGKVSPRRQMPPSTQDLLKQQAKSRIENYPDESKKQNLVVPIMSSKTKNFSTNMVNFIGVTPIKNEISKDSFNYQSTVRHDSQIINANDDHEGGGAASGGVRSSHNRDAVAIINFREREKLLVPEEGEHEDLDSTPTHMVTSQKSAPDPDSPIEVVRPTSKYQQS